MKLFRYGSHDNEKPGVLWEGKHLSLESFGYDYDADFFANNGIEKLNQWLPENASSCNVIDLSKVRIAPPLIGVSKIVCIGLNYKQHAAESGMDIPNEPILFFKSTTAIVGPNDPVMLPKDGHKTDWEVELAVIIGKKASYVPLETARDYVLGYTVHNDVSERSFQLERSGQWVKGKSCDTFAPIGPYLVTYDESHLNPNNLNLWLKLNGKIVQNSSTSDFIFNIEFLVHYISQFMTLLPGDIISTGTPSGVGLGFDPPMYLKSGDTMELGIEHLGTMKQTVIPFSDENYR
ncbi:MAG: fumarylacetoacetate hydrolase family protein [Flavobacteriaceae bacterium]|nr:fumarylacetoacetate hydrolase family protein [Flavobacteriaceae bacterium]